IADKEDAAKTLQLADRQKDEAAENTNHGKSQRLQSQNAFETGFQYEQQQIEEETRQLYQACAEIWRRHSNPQTRDNAAEIHDVWKG
ncbi:hypothetical protein, partial [Klebsiella pneumoniae]|uniref:hypothetical protein n=1 Tax=Klebsiella pneumoniae TaxID=573 RepID=UPI003B5A102A